MHKTTVVIVSWNSRDYLRGCLESLQAAGVPEVAEIVVVDNASTDGSQEMVRKDYPVVSLVALDQNIGFAGANNVAMRNAKTAYVLLLNPDTEVVGQAIQELVGFMEGRPEVWGAGPALLNSDRTTQQTGVRFPSSWNILVEALYLDRVFPRSRIFGRHKELFADSSKPRKVDYVQGSCLIVRTDKVIPLVGFLDEQYFMYFEETDWCFRIRKAGGEIWICPKARVVHHGGGEEGHYDERRVLYYHQGLFRYLKKHSTPLAGMAVRAVVFLRSVIRIFSWLIAMVIRPSVRTKASSTLKGYLHVILLCFTPSPSTVAGK